MDWNKQYEDKSTPWDIGYPSPPLTDYIDQLEDKSISILIPGAGNGHEAAYLHEKGFNDVTIIDLAKIPLENFKKRNPDFPAEKLIQGNFFDHQGQYDLILEQTFLSALSPTSREDYMKQMNNLLKPEGKLVGVLFGSEFEKEGPPYGGTHEEYTRRFSDYFNIKRLEKAYNSIEPRLGSELFFQVLPIKR